MENLTIPAGRCGTQSRTKGREIGRENAERREGRSATKSVIPHSRYYLTACRTRYNLGVYGFSRSRDKRLYISIPHLYICISLYIYIQGRNERGTDWPFSSATPPTFTGTRPTCHFAASSESSLDTYRIIAARLPFYNSRRRFVEMQKGYLFS